MFKRMVPFRLIVGVLFDVCLTGNGIKLALRFYVKAIFPVRIELLDFQKAKFAKKVQNWTRKCRNFGMKTEVNFQLEISKLMKT